MPELTGVRMCLSYQAAEQADSRSLALPGIRVKGMGAGAAFAGGGVAAGDAPRVRRGPAGWATQRETRRVEGGAPIVTDMLAGLQDVAEHLGRTVTRIPMGGRRAAPNTLAKDHAEASD
jgi:hypothetical protein